VTSAGMINAQYPNNAGAAIQIIKKRSKPPKELGSVV
jgi:hypothetical protein